MARHTNLLRIIEHTWTRCLTVRCLAVATTSAACEVLHEELEQHELLQLYAQVFVSSEVGTEKNEAVRPTWKALLMEIFAGRDTSTGHIEYQLLHVVVPNHVRFGTLHHR